jgi:hypothetical protein
MARQDIRDNVTVKLTSTEENQDAAANLPVWIPQFWTQVSQHSIHNGSPIPADRAAHTFETQEIRRWQ